MDRSARKGSLLLSRRQFCAGLLGGAAVLWAGCRGDVPSMGVYIPEVEPGEDLFGYIRRKTGGFDQALYQRVIGAANEYKEGDEILGVSAADEASRQNARRLLSNTRIGELHMRPLFSDEFYARLLTTVDAQAAQRTAGWTLGELRAFLLSSDEAAIKGIMVGLSSDTIGCVIKLMSNEDLIAVGKKVFNPLPGTQIGARGYMGARIQPNSPTDNVDDILWQVMDGWAYAVGDVVLGCNPVSSDPDSVAAIESALLDVLRAFKLEDVMPHCVLAHIDVQAEVESKRPGTTGIWFQSLAGSTAANATFDVTTEKMVAHAAKRGGKYGLYFETGQGADFTNGHGQGTDMVVHESRKYGFARLLTREVAAAQRRAGRQEAPWVHVNDVAGFIGPEVFRSREQLVRCCLEDIVMGKLHGVMIGLDVCSTLHMDVSLDDLDWCLDQILPANPGYLMGLPTKNDPMLGYLTTAFQDHVRLRERFGYKVNDAMWAFFQRLGVIDAQGKPTEHFGDPIWVYLQYRKAKGDARSEAEIRAEGMREIAEVRKRGVPIAQGWGRQPWDLEPGLDREIRDLYADAKKSIWAEMTPSFKMSVPMTVMLRTGAADRMDYILHPANGERLDDAARAAVVRLRGEHAGRFNVQIVISEGLNAYAIMDEGHLTPYLMTLRQGLGMMGFKVAPENLLVTAGRVRAGYRIGEVLYGALADQEVPRGIIHVIGERPGSMHHTFSAYITAPRGKVWAETDRVDHNITKVVSGIADTALSPPLAAQETVRLLEGLWRLA